ncbi:MAG: hypothetical protein C0468_06220 [Planctomyces sp.]|nr:hypothetical protein [Planctomyces sp.]
MNHAEPTTDPTADGAAPQRACGLSVLVLTKNEEVNIAACLDSVRFSDDVVVYDSYSTDRTVEIALGRPNVRVVQRRFDNWSAHQNWGVSNIAFRHPWVLYIDADERVDDQLRAELCRVCAQPGEMSAYRVRRKDMFMGRWLRRAQLYPTWLVRVFRPEKIRYERLVNPVATISGPTGELAGHLIHHPFSKGLMQWFERHNSYSGFEAEEFTRPGRFRPPLAQALSTDPDRRRAGLKELFNRAPSRPLARLLYLLLLRRAVLDGAPGTAYSFMISMYEYWIELKMREIRAGWRADTEAMVARVLGRRAGPGARPAAVAHELAGQVPEGGSAAQSPAQAPAQPPAGPGPARGPRLGAVDVLIATYNESAHIAQTVANARRLGNVYVLDSLSTDGTQGIARQAGATVVEHPFENYSRQKNWGLDNLPLTAEWVFILDADERITPALEEEVRRTVADPRAADGYFVNRVVIMMGRAIWHGGMFPSWNMRLFRRGKCRYEDRSVHEHMICDGPTAYLRGLMLHIRRETIGEYIAKHIRYADMESDEWLKQRLGSDRSARAGRLFRDAGRFRLILRRDVWPRVPMQPLIRFIYMYFFRLGFLDGAAGWHLACLMASYEYMIKLLYRQKLQCARDGSLAVAPNGKLVPTAPPASAPPPGPTVPPPAPVGTGARAS